MKYTSSKFAKYGLNPGTIETPDARFNISDATQPLGAKLQFETIEDAHAEDKFRIKSLQLHGNADALALAGEMLSAEAKGKILISLISSQYNSQLRRKLIPLLLKLFATFPKGDVRAFTLVIPPWWIKENRLNSISAQQLKRSLRGLLERAGMLALDGVVFACLHVEHAGGGFQFHFHGVVAGEKIQALKRLGILTTKHRRKVKHPLVVSGFDHKPDPLKELASWLGYAMRIYCNYKPRFKNKAGVERKRIKSMRVPEPAHSEILVWQAKQNPHHILFFNGMALKNIGGTCRLAGAGV
jgi:hypothetical protein